MRLRPRVFEEVLHKIRVDIAEGRVPPGGQLAPERLLAKRYGVSRGSIRDAVRALELFGLVRIKRGRDGGVFTTENCVEIARNSFTSLAALERYGFAETLEFRKLFEPRAAALAAVRATEDDLNLIQKTLLMLAENPTSAEIFAESNRTFHEAIASATGNPYLRSLVPQFFATTEVTSAAHAAVPIQRSQSLFFHTRIYEAIKERNPKDAEVWMDAHLSQLECDLRRGRELSGREPPIDTS